MVKSLFIPVGILVFLAAASPVPAATAEELVAKLRAVGREGANNPEAAKAWKELVRCGPDALVPILAGMDDGKKTATNWLRPAVDAIVEKANKDKQPLPKDALEEFVGKTGNPPSGRRVAFELLTGIDKTTAERLLPGMVHDPSPELRFEAVAAVMGEAKKALEKEDKKAATAFYQKALGGANDKEQVEEIVKQLKALGVEVDVAAHLGFIRAWHLIEPFDNTDEAGYKVTYMPEKGVDLAAKYKGKGGDEVKWTETTTDDPYGVVDLNKVFVKKKSAIAYAYVVVDSPAERAVQIRLGTENAVKVFLNGKEVFGRDEYHHGMDMDQYSAAAVLKAGRNELLLKVCQNDDKVQPSDAWSFQVRLCDAAGAAVPFTVASPKPKDNK
jgi:hypothetical protein